MSAEVFEVLSNIPGRVRVVVGVLVGLVVVLAVLTELCLLQAATLRRKVRAVLPPEEGDEKEQDR